MVLEALEWGWAAHLPATGMTWRPKAYPFTSAERGGKGVRLRSWRRVAACLQLVVAAML